MYLAPAIQWAIANKKRVVVSTSTINLQEQLIGKDLPDLAQRLDLKFKAVLVKGRSNYISLRRLGYALGQSDLLLSNRAEQIKQIADWSGKTNEGSKSELPFEIAPDAWDAVMSDKDDCLRARCPHYDECFFYKSRREASSADVIVANHHLVMADVAAKKDHTGAEFAAILPPFERLIFDEAHHVEEVATEYFSTETSQFAIRRQLFKLTGGRTGKGALSQLLQAVNRADIRGIYPVTALVSKKINNDIPLVLGEVEVALDNLFDQLFFRTLAYFGLESLTKRERRQVRITSEVVASEYWRQAMELLEQIASHISSLTGETAKMLDSMREYPQETMRELLDARAAVASIHVKLKEHAASIAFFLKAPDSSYCRWFDIGYVRERPAIRPCTAPLDIAPQLRAALFARKKSVVLTSATLTVDGRFDFFSRQIGLFPRAEKPHEPNSAENSTEAMLHQQICERTDFLSLDTPFDYASHCMVGIPLDTPSPLDPGFDRAIAPTILDAIRITDGRAFVLFTSYRALQQVWDELSGTLKSEDMMALRQGEMPRAQLLEVFKKSQRAVLFATSSFWEGVDVAGEALQSLVMARLPFRVPTTPILEARTEKINHDGGDSFRDLTIPLAVIKFKQGFGRLIRSRFDRGVVLILDHRVATKNYGRTFLRSLPPAKIIRDNTAEVLTQFRGFFT